MDPRPVGVFDSGIGGLSILRALRAELPHEDFIYYADTAHAPYGERADSYVIDRTLTIAKSLIDERDIKALVVACNTATAAAIHLLRAAYPTLPLVGVEPALKPAVAHSKTGKIGVMATRMTLASEKFRTLSSSFDPSKRFVPRACDGLVEAMERGDEPEVARLAAFHVNAMGKFGSGDDEIDTLVLGCTHYPFVAPLIQAAAGESVRLIETGVPVSLQTRRLLNAANLLNADENLGGIELSGSGSPEALRAAADRWL